MTAVFHWMPGVRRVSGFDDLDSFGTNRGCTIGGAIARNLARLALPRLVP